MKDLLLAGDVVPFGPRPRPSTEGYPTAPERYLPLLFNPYWGPDYDYERHKRLMIGLPPVNDASRAPSDTEDSARYFAALMDRWQELKRLS